MEWPQLLGHPFWAQAVTGEIEEEEMDEDKENGWQGVVSATLRCADIVLSLQLWLKSADFLSHYCMQLV